MHLLIQVCKCNDRDSQRLLYQYYASICIRYTRNMTEAKEVVNDGFMKVFGKIYQFNQNSPFKGWIRKIMINTSIDQDRKELKHQQQDPIEFAHSAFTQPQAITDLSHEDLIGLVRSYHWPIGQFLICLSSMDIDTMRSERYGTYQAEHQSRIYSKRGKI